MVQEDEEFHPAMDRIMVEESHPPCEAADGASFPATESSTSPRHTEAISDQVRKLNGGILDRILKPSMHYMGSYCLYLSIQTKLMPSLPVLKT